MNKLVLIQRDRGGAKDGWYRVLVRRQDDSLFDVACCEFRPDAQEVAQRVRAAIRRREAWVSSILDVSAGALRAAS